jgi:hypothetical protein
MNLLYRDQYIQDFRFCASSLAAPDLSMGAGCHLHGGVGHLENSSEHQFGQGVEVSAFPCVHQRNHNEVPFFIKTLEIIIGRR